MRLVLKVWSSNPDYSAGCDYAVVEASAEFAKLALRRIHVLREQKALDPSLNEMYYWDWSAEYFSPSADCAIQPGEVQESCAKLEEMLEELEIEAQEIATAPASLRVLESQIAVVECAEMIVRHDSIAFTAIPKHTDIHLTTAEMSQHILESMLRTAAA